MFDNSTIEAHRQKVDIGLLVEGQYQQLKAPSYSSRSAYDDREVHHPHSLVEDQGCSGSNVWFVKDNGTCHCGSDLDGVVKCDADTKGLSVIDCYCLIVEHTADGEVLPLAGACIFSCINETNRENNMLYHSAPSDCPQCTV